MLVVFSATTTSFHTATIAETSSRASTVCVVIVAGGSRWCGGRRRRCLSASVGSKKIHDRWIRTAKQSIRKYGPREGPLYLRCITVDCKLADDSESRQILKLTSRQTAAQTSIFSSTINSGYCIQFESGLEREQLPAST